MALPSVAVVGVSGHVGKEVAKALLSPTFRDSFSSVVFLKRGDAPVHSEEHLNGAEVRHYNDGAISDALSGVDVLINTVGPSGHRFKDKLIDAIASSDVKLYMPSEFGVDHNIHDFPHAEWSQKKSHYTMAKAIIPKVKICRIYVGLFTEDSIGPWFGFNTKSGIFESIGSPDQTISFTALCDVGKVAAQLARMPVEQVPEQLHIGGDALTVKQLARAMGSASSSDIEVKVTDLNAYKQKTLDEGTKDPSKYLRFLMGEGKINHTVTGLGLDNEYVNPGQRYWQWKTLAKYASETKGRPWDKFDWSTESVE